MLSTCVSFGRSLYTLLKMGDYSAPPWKHERLLFDVSFQAARGDSVCVVLKFRGEAIPRQ